MFVCLFYKGVNAGLFVFFLFLLKAYATVAKAYEETLGKDKSKRMFFFIKVKYDDDPDMFRMYGMNHAPQMIYIPSEGLLFLLFSCVIN